VGSHTAEYYAKRGSEVVILDNLMRSQLFNYDKESVEYNWNYLDKYSNIRKIKGDVRNKENVYEAIGDGVDVVIHTAAQPVTIYGNGKQVRDLLYVEDLVKAYDNICGKRH